MVYYVVVYKYVFFVEDNVIEGICNNVFGILVCVNVVIEVGVKNFILILMDKVVWLMNIMGVSKWMVELVL